MSVSGDYKSAHTAAVMLARQLGREVGIEKCQYPRIAGGEYRVFSLPRRENRQGFELRCEVISPSDPL